MAAPLAIMCHRVRRIRRLSAAGVLGLTSALSPAAALAQRDPPPSAVGAVAGHGPPHRFDNVLDVRDYGAKGDGASDDTAAFQAAIGVAVRTIAPLTSNTGAMIHVPCGKYILTARLTATVGPNAAIGLTGDTAGCSELQWNVAGGGIDFELPQQSQTSSSRSNAGAGRGLGVAIDVEHLALVNNAPGNVYTGTALRISQPVPTKSLASNAPDTTISDIRWYSNAPGRGGRGAQGQAWRVGIELVNMPWSHVDHASGEQWGSASAFGPPDSAGIHIVSTGPRGTYYDGQIWITNYFQQGAWRGVGIDGDNVQGVYVSGLMLLQNSISFDWEAPAQDASASFTMVNSSINGELAGIYMNRVRQVMISNTEILNGGAGGFPGGKLTRNYYGIYANDTDNLMVDNNVLIPLCSGCARSQVDAGHRGYGIWLQHGALYDNQASVINGNSIAYGDVGIHAAGGQILVSANAIAAQVIAPVEDGSAALGSTVHPAFVNNQHGASTISTQAGDTLFNGSTTVAGVTSYQALGPNDLIITASDRSANAYQDRGVHSQSSIDLTGATDRLAGLALSASSTGSRAIEWFDGNTQAASWGLFYADRPGRLFHEKFPGISVDVGGVPGALLMTGAAITAAVPIGLSSYAVARLPAGCVAGQMAFASDGRNPGEAASAGTGTTVFCNKASRWFATSSGAAVTD